MTTTTTNIFRQGLLRYLSQQQLALIESKRISIGGAGGLGSNCAMILVRSGFKNFEIIDQDVIDPSNFNRQQYFSDEVGLPKVDTLKKRLLEINPEPEMQTHQKKWTLENGHLYFKDCDYIVEAFDAVDWKYKFVEYYQETGKPIISGIGMAGLTQKGPMTVKKLGNIWFVGDRETCSHQGHPPMAPRVTQCAAMMAEVVLDLNLNL